MDCLESIRLHLVLQPQIRLLALQLNGQALSSQLAVGPEGVSIDPWLSAYNQLQLDVVEEAEMARAWISPLEWKVSEDFRKPLAFGCVAVVASANCEVSDLSFSRIPSDEMVSWQTYSGRRRPCGMHPATDSSQPIGPKSQPSAFGQLRVFKSRRIFGQHRTGPLGCCGGEVCGGTCGDEVGRGDF